MLSVLRLVISQPHTLYMSIARLRLLPSIGSCTLRRLIDIPAADYSRPETGLVRKAVARRHDIPSHCITYSEVNDIAYHTMSSYRMVCDDIPNQDDMCLSYVPFYNIFTIMVWLLPIQKVVYLGHTKYSASHVRFPHGFGFHAKTEKPTSGLSTFPSSN